MVMKLCDTLMIKPCYVNVERTFVATDLSITDNSSQL